MACNCVKVNVSVTADNIVLTPASALTLTDTQSFCFKLSSAIPSVSASLPVVMVVNTANTPVVNKYGNPISATNLKANKCIFAYFGADGDNRVLCPKLPVTMNCSFI